MQKRTYYIPTTEIITLQTERLMGMADASNLPDLAPRRVERRVPAF